MKIKKTIALLAAFAIVLSVLPVAALASWADDDDIDKYTQSFTSSGGGHYEVRFFDSEGSQFGFYEKDGGYYADDAGLADKYAAEGFTSAGDFVTVLGDAEPVSVTYALEGFGRFELTAIPESGFVFYRFVDPECGCSKSFEQVGDVFQITQQTAETVEAVFKEDDEADAGTGAAPGMTMKLDGKIVPSDVAPFILDGRTFVPVRFVSEALGAGVVWDAGSGTVTVTADDGMVIKLKNGDKDMLIQKGGEDAVVTMDVAAIVTEGRTFIPVRFIAEALGFKVGWDGQTKTVLLATYSDALRFKDEYEALNGVLNDDGTPQYSKISIDEANNIVYLDYAGLIDFIKNGSGLLYFGRPGCPWCRLLAPVMLDFASEDNVKVFYYDIEKDRAENNEQYKSVLALLGEHLPTDTVTQSESDAGFDPNLKRVVLPQLFFIDEGKVVGSLYMYQHEFLRDNETEKTKQMLRDKYAPIISDSGDSTEPCDCE